MGAPGRGRLTEHIRPFLPRKARRALRAIELEARGAERRLRRRFEQRQWIRFYREFLRPGDLCFDVGANEGNRTEIFLGLGARVVAVEPHPGCARFLNERFRSNPRFVLVVAAAGSAPGHAELRTPVVSTIASMSPEWIHRVRESGRFREYTWNDVDQVRVTTLDVLIDVHGAPAFCKIDVEGYEPHVIAGLTYPVSALSFEFTPEYLNATRDCLSQLEARASYEYNFALNEDPSLMEARWLTAEEILVRLSAFTGDATVFGDVYARLAGAARS